MEHPDDEVLTQFALDDPLALDAATLVHISDCDQCTHEIEAIQRVVDAALAAGGRPDLRTLAPPPAEVWDRVLGEVGVGATWMIADRGSSSDTTTAGDVRTSSLTGIDGHSTSGEIALKSREGAGPQITVSIDSLDKGPGFLEAWLLDADTGGMVALGV